MRPAIKRGVGVWVVFGALLLAWSGAAGTYNRTEESRVSDQMEQIDREEHFYRVAAGQIPGDSSPADKLARDLHETTTLRLTEFKGDSNRYAGITDDLGFDPFQDGDNCPECGRLDNEIVFAMIEIKDGKLDEVLAANRVEVEPAKSQSGVPTILYVLWLASLPTYIVIAYVRRRRHEEETYREFTSERELVEQLRRTQHELPPGSDKWDALDNLADELEDQMERRIKYRSEKKREIRLEYLTKEASDTLAAFKAGNQSLD